MINDPVLTDRLRELTGYLNTWAREPAKWREAWRLDELDIPPALWNLSQPIIGQQAADLLKQLEQVRSKLAAPDADAATIKDAWKTYTDVYLTSQELFAQCLQFLRGLVVRERLVELYKAGNTTDDTTVFAAVDWLTFVAARDWLGDPQRATLTLPGTGDPLVDKPGRATFLRFPEWRIWTLPLAAYDYAYRIVQEMPAFAGVINTLKDHYLYDVDPPLELLAQHVPLYMADGLATLMFGPAYACAAVLLRFDVVGTYDKDERQPAAARRATIIFGILERMNQDAIDMDDQMPYQDIIERITCKWEETLTYAGSNGKLAVGDQAHLKALVDAIWQARTLLNSNAVYPYQSGGGSTEGWDMAQACSNNWKDQIEKGRDEFGPPLPNAAGWDSVPDLPTLRDALNAAWYLRVTAPQVDPARIALATRRLCSLIISAERNKAGQAGQIRPKASVLMGPKEADKSGN